MLHISLNVAALAVAVIFYTWRGYAAIEQKRRLRLRERIAFMLWAMADQTEMEDADALLALK
jgi:hypothetical protein